MEVLILMLLQIIYPGLINKTKKLQKILLGKENLNEFFLSIGNDQLGELLKQNLKNSNNEVLNYVFNNKNPTNFCRSSFRDSI